MSRSLVVLGILVSTMLVGCATTGRVDGPVLTSPRPGLLGGDSMAAIVAGTLRFSEAQECLLLEQEVATYSIVWPWGASWRADPPGVLLRDGVIAEPGAWISGGGGYLPRRNVEHIAGAKVADAARRLRRHDRKSCALQPLGHGDSVHGVAWPGRLASMRSRPSMVFLCVHNAGRSQMAAAFAREFGGDRVEVFSGGSDPGAAVNPVAVAAMLEVGIDMSGAMPAKWTDEIVRDATVVVTMGCGDECPYFPGVTYRDWELDDPSGLPLEEIRPIRDDIEQRVRALLEEFAPR